MSLNVRISHKYDTYAEWQKSTIILNKGELAICEIPTAPEGGYSPAEARMTPPAIGIKVGDGEKTFAQLPWIQATSGDVYAWAKKETLQYSDLDEAFLTNLKGLVAGEVQDTNTNYSFEFANNQLIIKSREKTDPAGTYPTTVATLDIDLTTKVDKVQGTAGNIVNFGADGAIADSGEKIGDYLKKEDAEKTYATQEALSDEIDGINENISKNITPVLTQATKDIGTLQEQIKGLSGAMHFEGAVTSDPTVDGFDVEGYENGDVVVWVEEDKEYVFYNGAFYELGDVSAEGQRLTALESAVGNAESGLVKQMADAEAAIGELEEDSHTHSFADETALNGITAAKVAAWDAAEQNAKDHADTEIGKLSQEGGAIKALQDRAAALEGTVGDASKGLVKGVADNAAAIEGIQETISEDIQPVLDTALQSVSGVEGTKTGTDFKVTGVSTDLLKNGATTLVLNCGDAKTVI